MHHLIQPVHAWKSLFKQNINGHNAAESGYQMAGRKASCKPILRGWHGNRAASRLLVL